MTKTLINNSNLSRILFVLFFLCFYCRHQDWCNRISVKLLNLSTYNIFWKIVQVSPGVRIHASNLKWPLKWTCVQVVGGRKGDTGIGDQAQSLLLHRQSSPQRGDQEGQCTSGPHRQSSRWSRTSPPPLSSVVTRPRTRQTWIDGEKVEKRNQPAGIANLSDHFPWARTWTLTKSGENAVYPHLSL